MTETQARVAANATCGPNRAKLSAHTRESTESSPPSMPCSLCQLRSGAAICRDSDRRAQYDHDARVYH